MRRRTWRNRVGVVSLPLIVKVKSKGWDDPGYIGGPPEDCREPESEDEREIVGVWLGSASVEPGDERFDALRNLLQEQVDGEAERDVDWEEGDSRNPDAEREDEE